MKRAEVHVWAAACGCIGRIEPTVLRMNQRCFSGSVRTVFVTDGKRILPSCIRYTPMVSLPHRRLRVDVADASVQVSSSYYLCVLILSFTTSHSVAALAQPVRRMRCTPKSVRTGPTSPPTAVSATAYSKSSAI